MVTKEEIEQAKSVSLIDIVDNGENHVVRGRDCVKIVCPFHSDYKTPSLVVYEDHYHCYGCGAHGDGIEFVKKVYSVTFEEAVNALNNKNGNN